MPEESAGEKVFPASPRKRLEARKKGQVARSPELSGALVLLALVIVLRLALTSGYAYDSLKADLFQAFSFNPHIHSFDQRTATLWELRTGRAIVTLILPAMFAALALGLAVNVAQVGLVLTPHMLVPDFNKLNPANGLKRMFSVRGTVELIKGASKIVIIAWICWATLRDHIAMIEQSLNLPLVPFLCEMGELLWALGLHVCCALFVLAVSDYAYQKYDFEKTMRMSREEMKQETKNSDGDPHVKQRIKQRQRAMAQKRMMQQVPKATVVVTNPTHFAVALRYEKGMAAPIVIARGQDLVALRIKEIAREHNIPTVENRPVARALYSDVRIGQEIPLHLYKAVAEVLAFVYRTGKRAA